MEYTQAVSSFKKYLAVEKGYSPLTVKEYDMDLNLLYNFLIDKMNFKKDFIIEDISKFEIAEFLADIILVDESSPATRNRKLYSIRSFFNYLTKNEYINNNPTLTIEASKTEIRAEPIYLKLDDARRYIDTIKKYGSINQKRDLAIVKLFLYAGLRVSELVNLNLDNIDFHNQSIKFFGKGNKERSIPLHQDVIQAISEYFTERREIKKKKLDDRSTLFLCQISRY